MTNNTVLRRLRYLLALNEQKMQAIFEHTACPADTIQLANWLCKEGTKEEKPCPDQQLAYFLNGLIIERRGRQTDKPEPIAETKLTNNLILKKLKIAFDLQAEDILTLLSTSDFILSRHELSAFFRRPDHKHYRLCQDQVLRHFLTGLQHQHRPSY